MKIQWLGHACFLVSSGEYSIALDPYADGKVPGLRPLRIQANAIRCSHSHNDHSAREVVSLRDENLPSPFTITMVESYHDDKQGESRGPNIIYILEAENLRVAHLGDLGHTLTAAQIAAIGRLDAAMIPIGGHYTIDAVAARAVADHLGAAVTIPMHFRADDDAFGYPVIGTLGEYLALCDDVVRYSTDTIEITPDMPKQTAVLQYQ